MSRVVVVVPSIVASYTAECLATLDPALIDVGAIGQTTGYQREHNIFIGNGKRWSDGHPELRLVVVYNTPERNLGVAGSWNVGVDETLRGEADWLVIMSAAVRFGPMGGGDFLAVLDLVGEDSPIIQPGWPTALEADSGLGWHLIAFHREVLERVGRFDPIFHPAYSEDLDYSRRIQLAYGVDSTAPDFVGPLWPKYDTDAKLVGVAHGIKHGGVNVDFVEIERRYIAKWGAKSPGETFTHPYDDPTLDWTFTGPHA